MSDYRRRNRPLVPPPEGMDLRVAELLDALARWAVEEYHASRDAKSKEAVGGLKGSRRN